MSFIHVTLMSHTRKTLYSGILCMVPLSENAVMERCRNYYEEDNICRFRKERMKRILYIEIEEQLLKNASEQEGIVPKQIQGLFGMEEVPEYYVKF